MPMMRPDASWLIVTLTSIPIGFSAGRRNGEKSSPGALIHDHSCTRLQGLQVGWLVGVGGGTCTVRTCRGGQADPARQLDIGPLRRPCRSAVGGSYHRQRTSQIPNRCRDVSCG
jgi:hypothetical protein